MKKFKVHISFYLLIILCCVTNKLTLLFNYFVALFLHELAHLFVATCKGYKLKQINLSIFGFFIDLKEQIDDSDSFLINLAGPSFNLLLSVCCVALFWLFPSSYNVLNTFCFSNLALALFNLIPIYPLDGGKIFKGLFKNKNHFTYFNMAVKIVFIVTFGSLFICSFFSTINFFYLLFAVFFMSLTHKQEANFTVIKYDKKQKIEKIELVKIDESLTLFQLLKKLQSRRYTIFYLQNTKKYLDEDMLIEFSLKYELTTPIYKCE